MKLSAIQKVALAWAEILRRRSRVMCPEITVEECAVLARLLEDLCR